MKRKALSLMLALIMVLGLLVPGAAALADDTVLKWTADFGTDWTKTPNTPSLVGDKLAVMSGTAINLLSSKDGSIVKTGVMSSSPSYGAAPVAYDGKVLYAPLGKGTVEAFDADTLESKWIYSDSLKGQALSPILCTGGKLYVGFWNGEAADANFVCIDAESGKMQWSYTVKGGFYWAAPVEIGEFIAVATDDGAKGSSGDSSLLVFKKTYAEGETAAPVSKAELKGCGDVRCGLTCDGGKLYFTSKGGYLGSVSIDKATGALSGLKTVSFGAQSVSTPVIYGDYVYFGAGAGVSSNAGKFMIADKNTLEVKNSVELKGYPQCSMLLSADELDITGYLKFYSTYNARPGGISLIKVNAQDVSDTKLIEFYDAAGHENYCVSSVVTDGTNLYYKNDSGCIFCLNIETAAAEVLVSISDKGSAELVRTQMKVADLNSDGKVDIGEVLTAAHDKYCPGGFEATSGDYGSYITKLWNDESGNYMYFVDNKMAMGLDETVTDGQHVYAYVAANAYPNTDAYAYFDKPCVELDAYVSADVMLFAQSGYDTDWNPLFSGFENAELKAYSADLKTEVKGFSYRSLGGGSYSVSFKNSGEYIVLATAENNAIAPAALMVSVDGAQVAFKDLRPGAFYYNAVVWGSANDIVRGMSKTEFEPESECTRAQITSLLYRLAGNPAVEGGCSFKDVGDEWFRDAVIWAAENGITKGTTADTFSPNAECTRAEAITFLYRYMGGRPTANTTLFTDADTGAFYYNALMWAAENGIIKGYPDGGFHPMDTCTRAEIVTMIYRTAA